MALPLNIENKPTKAIPIAPGNINNKPGRVISNAPYHGQPNTSNAPKKVPIVSGKVKRNKKARTKTPIAQPLPK